MEEMFIKVMQILNHKLDNYYQRHKNGDISRECMEQVNNFFSEVVSEISEKVFEKIPQGEKNVSEDNIREQSDNQHGELREPEPDV